MSAKPVISPGCGFGELFRTAWTSLKGNWPIAIGTYFVFSLILGGLAQIKIFSGLINILIYPLTAGTFLFALKLLRKEPLSINLLFQPFNQYLRFVWSNIRSGIFVFLWSLLLIVPGIIAMYRYSMTAYIMLDDPDCSVKEAMQESSDIMYGHKLQLFGYSLLWFLIVLLVGICTLSIGFIWLIPLIGVWGAAFYESIRRRPEEESTFSDSVDAEIVS